MAINWNDQDILLMGSNLGKKLKYYKESDLDEVTLGKLAIWFMNNYDDLYEIYRESERLLNFMNDGDSDFLENIEDNRPSLKVYEKSLELVPSIIYYNNSFWTATTNPYPQLHAFINHNEKQWVWLHSGMTKFYKRVTKICASGLWVKPNPLAQQLWALRTSILILFAMIRFMFWYYSLVYFRVSNDTIDGFALITYREIVSKFLNDWFRQFEDLEPLGRKSDWDDYVGEWKDRESRKQYRQWGVDPALLQEQRAFINSLALLIRRGLSESDRVATTFRDERYNTANELKALAKRGWSPDLPEDIDVEECPKCDGYGYRVSANNKKRKCTTCQGWGHIGENVWLYQKQYDTGRHSRNQEVRSWDISNENQRRRFNRLVSTFKSECVGNYK